jgi:molybdopterin-guanine dinucleotide biosynthesis protein MobB
MKNPIVFGFYGESNSGKTKLIENIVEKLTQDNLKVATIKKTDKKIGIDTEGKDTWKHNKAGAEIVVFSSPIETDVIIKKHIPVKEIIQYISDLGIYDVILVEGAVELEISKIRLGAVIKRENTIFDYQNNLEEIIKLIKKEINLQPISKEKISIFVNGNAVQLSEFPAEIIHNTIIGMIKSLKGVAKIEQVKIQIKN